MSLFKKKAPKYTPPPVPPTPTEETHQQSNGLDNNNGTQKSQLVFHCQQAHGSPLGLISGFSNVKELYQKIAECYDFPPEDVLTALSFYATGSYQRLIGNQEGHSMAQQTVSSVIAQVTACLNSIQFRQKYIHFPVNEQERNKIKAEFYNKFQMPGVLGCIDCTHVAIVRPVDHEERYYSRKHYHSLNVQVILFCTLNTHKVDMKKLLGGQIGLEDFIFAHRKGRPKEIEIVKTEDALGLTITDNGAGYAFIKRIKEGSIVSRIPHIEVGDHIEKLDGENMVGKRHYEVAKILKDIPKGTTFIMRLVEPLKSGFGSIGPKTSTKSGKKSYGSGKETLRFKSNGQATIENEHDEKSKAGIEKINGLLELFMGVSDNELASQMWDLADGKNNSMELAEAIDNSDLQEFGFTDEFIIELWGVITDARSGRLS